MPGWGTKGTRDRERGEGRTTVGYLIDGTPGGRLAVADAGPGGVALEGDLGAIAGLDEAGADLVEAVLGGAVDVGDAGTVVGVGAGLALDALDVAVAVGDEVGGIEVALLALGGALLVVVEDAGAGVGGSVAGADGALEALGAGDAGDAEVEGGEVLAGGAALAGVLLELPGSVGAAVVLHGAVGAGGGDVGVADGLGEDVAGAVVADKGGLGAVVALAVGDDGVGGSPLTAGEALAGDGAAEAEGTLAAGHGVDGGLGEDVALLGDEGAGELEDLDVEADVGVELGGGALEADSVDGVGGDASGTTADGTGGGVEGDAVGEGVEGVHAGDDALVHGDELGDEDVSLQLHVEGGVDDVARGGGHAVGSQVVAPAGREASEAVEGLDAGLAGLGAVVGVLGTGLGGGPVDAELGGGLAVDGGGGEGELNVVAVALVAEGEGVGGLLQRVDEAAGELAGLGVELHGLGKGGGDGDAVVEAVHDHGLEVGGEGLHLLENEGAGGVLDVHDGGVVAGVEDVGVPDGLGGVGLEEAGTLNAASIAIIGAGHSGGAAGEGGGPLVVEGGLGGATEDLAGSLLRVVGGPGAGGLANSLEGGALGGLVARHAGADDLHLGVRDRGGSPLNVVLD